VPRPRRRVLILRTSRFADVAVERARARWPGAELRVASRDGRITPASIVGSRWGWRLVASRPTDVVLQWWDAEGRGHEAATWAALLLWSRGCHAVLADGAWIEISQAGPLGRALALAWYVLRGAIFASVIAIASAAVWPAATWLRWRERRRLA